MNIFHSMQWNIKLRNNSQHHSTIMTVILGMETPEKTGATVRYRFYYKKIWNVTIIANSPKPGECSYTTESPDKPLSKPQHLPARVYDPTVRPHTCGFTRPYDYCTKSVRSVWQLYRIRTEYYDLPL